MTFRDPNLVDFHQNPIPEQRIPSEWRAKYLERNPQQLAFDVAKAFDQQHELKKLQRRERDLLLEKYIESRRQLKWANWKIWIMGIIVSPIVSALLHKFFVWLFSH